MRAPALAAALGLLLLGGALAGEKAPVSRNADLKALPANTWTLLDESVGRGKLYARLIYAENVDRLYLWGTGGEKVDRTQYKPYELESFSLAERKWEYALPGSKKAAWADGRYPAFKIYGQGPNSLTGLRHRGISSMSCGYVKFFETEGVLRPSPRQSFNQCCWDAGRGRVFHHNAGQTFALDPKTNTWKNLKPSRSPLACGTLAWASTCYDPVNDEVLLFGGGLALNPDGGAGTWLYDCKKNSWRRPKLEVEPPLRCNSPVVYDKKSRAMVMFGGYDQAAALNDTWIYRCKERKWEERKPNPSPPPMFAPATAAMPGGGRVLVCGLNALTARWTHSSTRAKKETWVYDVGGSSWRPVGGDLDLLHYTTLSAAGSEKHGVVFLVANKPSWGKGARRLYALRYDPAGPAKKRPGAPAGTVRYKRPDQYVALQKAPPGGGAGKRLLAGLAANTLVDARPPGLLVSKTWSSATIDTGKGEVIYTGGGHSGYSGNDVAHYSLDENRWKLSYPPCFPPYLESTNEAVFGWSYGCRPWSQHTYLWYAYDPTTKMVVYCARPAGPWDGQEVLLEDDPSKVFIYSRAKHGYWTWVYDPEKKDFYRPTFGRRFGKTWGNALCTTPRGVYATTGARDNELLRAEVKGGRVTWHVVDAKVPAAAGKVHGEYQPLLYDSKAKRLLLLRGDKSRVQIHARGLAPGAKWTELKAAGKTRISREIVYVEKHNCLLSVDGDGIYVLDLASMKWRKLELTMPKGSYGHEFATVYDPKRDAAVLLVPRGFSGPLQTLLFRFDPKTAKFKE